MGYVFNKNDFINAVPLSPSLSSSLVTTNLEEGKKEKKNKNKKRKENNLNNDNKKKKKTKTKKEKEKMKKKKSSKKIILPKNDANNTKDIRKDKSKFVSVDQILKHFRKTMNMTKSLRNLNSKTSRQQEQQYNSDDSVLIEFVNDSSVCRKTPKALFEEYDTYGDDNVSFFEDYDTYDDDDDDDDDYDSLFDDFIMFTIE